MDRQTVKLGLAGVAGAAITLALLGLGGCAKFSEPYNDAHVDHKNDSAAVVYSMPDGFSNFATKCDENGNRVYVVFHGDGKYGGITVVPADPSCK